MASKLMVLGAFVAVANSQRFIRPNENPDLFQGDIVGVDDISDRNAITAKVQRWPNGVIQYTHDFSVFSIMTIIRQAMKHIEDHTCIKFKPVVLMNYDTEIDYVHFFAGKGKGGQQPISLGTGCGTVGMILHEIVHALGFAHEQNRSDRDDYLIIYFENITKGYEAQFAKLKPYQNWLINDFDYGSIMIYGETAGSKDGRSKTMVAKKPGATFLNPDEKSSLSASDIDRINILYECPSKTA